MTELSPGTHVVPLDAMSDAPPGTVGKLIAGTEMRIVSLTDPGKTLPADESGEILIRGPQIMKGYLGRPDATAAMIDADGWLHTGDVGHADSDGWLFVVDRVKELIKYKGFQVAPPNWRPSCSPTPASPTRPSSASTTTTATKYRTPSSYASRPHPTSRRARS